MAHTELIGIFQSQLKGRALPKMTHDGSVGQWLESQFGVRANSSATADWKGYELKTGKNKTTFGDWSADVYLWKIPNSGINGRDEFLKTFGTQSRANRPGRYSWSGKVFPTVNTVNEYGQIMTVEPNGDIKILYHYSRDQRNDKSKIIPSSLQRDNVVLAHWYATSLKTRVHDKFGINGWVKISSSKGMISEMHIGPPMKYKEWLYHVKNGTIFLDSGMYYDPIKPNVRPYSNWRASNKFWESLATHHIV